MKKAAVVAVAVWIVAALGVYGIPADKKESKEPAKVAEPRRPSNGNIVEVAPDGGVLWASDDHDSIAKALLMLIKQYEQDLARERLTNQILLEEVARLRGNR